MDKKQLIKSIACRITIAVLVVTIIVCYFMIPRSVFKEDREITIYSGQLATENGYEDITDKVDTEALAGCIPLIKTSRLPIIFAGSHYTSDDRYCMTIGCGSSVYSIEIGTFEDSYILGNNGRYRILNRDSVVALLDSMDAEE